MPPRGNPNNLRRAPGPGRKKGVPNRISVEARQLASQLVTDVNYQSKLRADFRKRRVHPTIESLIWQYHLGRPLQSVAVSGSMALDVSTRLDDERMAFAALDLADLELLAAESQQLVNRAFQLAGIAQPGIGTPQDVVAESADSAESAELLGNSAVSDKVSSVNYESTELLGNSADNGSVGTPGDYVNHGTDDAADE